MLFGSFENSLIVNNYTLEDIRIKIKKLRQSSFLKSNFEHKKSFKMKRNDLGSIKYTGCSSIGIVSEITTQTVIFSLYSTKLFQI